MGTRRDIQVPGHAAINIILVVGAVHPGDNAADKGSAVVRVGRITEFLDEHRAVGEGRINVGFPARGSIGAFIVIDMGRVDDAVAGRSSGEARIRDGLESRAGAVGAIIVGITPAASDTDIVGVGAAGQRAAAASRRSPDGIHNLLETRASIGVPGLATSVITRGNSASVEPDGPGIRAGRTSKRFVEGIENHRGIIGVTGGHTGPEDQTVLVRQRILLGSRTRGSVAGPLQVKIAIDVIGVAKGYERVHKSLITRSGTP